MACPTSFLEHSQWCARLPYTAVAAAISYRFPDSPGRQASEGTVVCWDNR